MDGIWLTLIFLLVLFTLLGSSVWIGISLLAVAWVGMELFTTRLVGDSMALTIWSASSSWTLTALPLFVWMGEILFRTDCRKICSRVSSPGCTDCPAACCMSISPARQSSPPSADHLLQPS